MKIIETLEEFFLATKGGKPPQMDISNFAGHKYKCGCGEKHEFFWKDGPELRNVSYSPIATYVLRQMRFGKFVFSKAGCNYHNIVEISMFGYFKTKATFYHGDPMATIKDYEEQFFKRNK